MIFFLLTIISALLVKFKNVHTDLFICDDNSISKRYRYLIPCKNDITEFKLINTGDNNYIIQSKYTQKVFDISGFGNELILNSKRDSYTQEFQIRFINSSKVYIANENLCVTYFEDENRFGMSKCGTNDLQVFEILSVSDGKSVVIDETIIKNIDGTTKVKERNVKLDDGQKLHEKTYKMDDGTKIHKKTYMDDNTKKVHKKYITEDGLTGYEETIKKTSNYDPISPKTVETTSYMKTDKGDVIVNKKYDVLSKKGRPVSHYHTMDDDKSNNLRRARHKKIIENSSESDIADTLRHMEENKKRERKFKY